MRVLLVGRNPELMAWAIDQLRANEFDVKGSTDIGTCFSLMTKETFDVIAVGGGIDTVTRATVHAAGDSLNSHPLVIDIFGPANLLPKLNAIRAERGLSNGR